MVNRYHFCHKKAISVFKVDKIEYTYEDKGHGNIRNVVCWPLNCRSINARPQYNTTCTLV